jgi:hypothetical protein
MLQGFSQSLILALVVLAFFRVPGRSARLLLRIKRYALPALCIVLALALCALVLLVAPYLGG